MLGLSRELQQGNLKKKKKKMLRGSAAHFQLLPILEVVNRRKKLLVFRVSVSLQDKNQDKLF